MTTPPPIRELEYTDLEWLRALRNANRQAFFSTEEITPDQQFLWWARIPLGDWHWVILDDARPIGYFAFVRPNPVLPIFPTIGLNGHVKYLNSLLLEPEYRGQGLMTTAIRSKMKENVSYCGYVRIGNEPSLKTCLAVGLKPMGTFIHADYGHMFVLWRG